MTKILVNTVRLTVCAIVTFQLVGCGTLMYPERRGQRGGRLDVGVAVLDGIGLLFFIIPGVIAFCVDFSNGTIYLPEHGMRVSLNNVREVKFDPKHSSLASIEKIIKTETGQEVKLADENITVTPVSSLKDV